MLQALLEVVEPVLGVVDDLSPVPYPDPYLGTRGLGQVWLEHHALLAAPLISLLPHVIVNFAGDEPEVPMCCAAGETWVLRDRFRVRLDLVQLGQARRHFGGLQLDDEVPVAVVFGGCS